MVSCQPGPACFVAAGEILTVLSTNTFTSDICVCVCVCVCV